MTKQDPNKLCPQCRKLNDEFQECPATIDVFIICEHDWEEDKTKPKGKEWNINLNI